MLSIYILTMNSERRLDQVLRSASGLAEEIVLVDSGSHDGTEAIARRHGARFLVRPFTDFTDQRRFALAQCRHDWVLALDADEVIGDALHARLLRLRDSRFMIDGHTPDAFAIRREWIALGRRVHAFYPSHCPDHPIRLFRRDGIDYLGGRLVHEKAVGFARASAIEEPILHYSCDTIDNLYGKINQYSSLSARQDGARGGRPGWFGIALWPWAVAARWYLACGGWRDGAVGLILSLYARDTVFQKMLKTRYDHAATPGPGRREKSGP